MTSTIVSRRAVLRGGSGLLLAGGLSSLLAACGGSSGSGSKQGASTATSDTLTVATSLGGTVFDPELPAVSLAQVPLLYDSLFDTSTPPDRAATQKLLANYEPSPALATKWEGSADGRTWTLTLNSKAMSPYGNTLSSADVLWSFERNLAMKWYGGIFLNRIGITDISQITAPTPDTVVFKPTTPSGRTYFLLLLGSFIVPVFDSTEAKKHVTASDKWASAWITRNACGFGPYTVKSASADGANVVFAANPHYYGTKPFSTVTWRQTTETATQLQLLLRGQAQIVDALSPVQVDSVKSSSTAMVTTVATTGEVYIGFNNSQAEYKDVALHQGIAYALDIEQAITSVYRGQATPMKSVIPDFFQGATSEFWVYKQDVEKARSLLAPYVGKGLVLQYKAGDPTLQTLAVLVQSSLKAAGLSVQLQSIDPTSFATKVTDATLSMWVSNQNTPLVPDSLYGLQLLFPTKPTQKLIHYSNADVDAAIDALATETDAAKQLEHIKAAQKILVNDLPILPMAQLPSIVPTAKNITNIRGHGSSIMWPKDLKYS